MTKTLFLPALLVLALAHSTNEASADVLGVEDFENKGDYLAPDDESLLYLQTKIRVLEEQVAAANAQIVALTKSAKTTNSNQELLYEALIEAGVISVEGPQNEF